MEVLKKERSTLRRFFTKALNTLEEKLVSQESTDVSASFKVMEDKAERLFAHDTKIQELHYTSEIEYDEQRINKEDDETEEYRDKWIVIKSKYEDRIQAHIWKGKPESIIYGNPDPNGMRNLRLPKLELKQFDGNIKNWIGFWGQFKRIHEDSSIPSEDKFQYLYQATVPGSSARELVGSFPPSADNYPKAIDQLKARFARDELLVQIYVRELLQLVLQRANMGNEMSLSSLYDKLETQLRALESLGVTSNKYAAMLSPLVESALPDETLKAWERSRTPQASADSEQSGYLEELLKFLRLEVDREERLFITRTSFQSGSGIKPRKDNERLSSAAILHSSEEKGRTCVWCDKHSHYSTDCFKVKDLNYAQKRDLLKGKQACFLCFKMGHNSKNCKAQIKCLLCGKRHHVIMCLKLNESVKCHQSKATKVNEKNETESLVSHGAQTLLQTLIVKLKVKGKYKLARVLLDSGSQRSYITKDSVSKLGLEKEKEEILTQHLFGGVKSQRQKHNLYQVTLSSMDETYKCTVPLLDQEKICNFIPRIDSIDHYPILKSKNITLSDVGYDIPDVKILLGADVMGKLLCGTVIELDEGLTAVQTKLGWTVMGQHTAKANFSITNTVTCLNAFDIPDLWQLDTIGIKDPVETKTKDNSEDEVLQFFKQTVKVNEEGRYEVRLPFKEGHPQLMNNIKIAEKRLTTTTVRLKALNKYERYDEIFEEWLHLGIIEPVLEKDNNDVHHYLPHRAVIKDASLTTKIRPVFDASAKDKNENSLNSCLETGPNLIVKIPQILMQFRKGAIGISSDIKKAFLQISLDERDRDFLRFLWWKHGQLIIYRHCRVVFGVSSSPFLLGATLEHHLDCAPDDLKATAEKLKDSFYIDNCVTSVESEQKLETFVAEADRLMSLGQFELRQWVSSPIGCTKQESPEDGKVQVLGLLWDIQTDELYCNVNLISVMSSPVTKRSLLSVAQKVFDPIGFTCPSTLLPKLLLQEIWKEKYRWDEELPEHIVNRFKKWVKQIHWLGRCRLPRRLATDKLEAMDLSLHVFCDASKCAYAACIYLRAQKDGEVSVQLVQAKVRVAPMKSVTIPRMELLAALIGTRLYHYVKDALGLNECKVYFWSDSAVVLAWIKRRKDLWSTFVGNRCKEICQYSNPEDWRHLPGCLNPADLPSRGCSPRTLFQSKWWEGPQWLKQDREEWPHSEPITSEVEVNLELKKTVVAMITLFPFDKDFVTRLLYFSHYMKMVRMIGWIFRFYHNCFRCNAKRTGELMCDEIKRAEVVLLKLIQSESFEEDKSWNKMQVFKDEEGLLRIRTKLLQSEESEEFKNPILLPSKHPAIIRLIEEEHRQSQHAGLQTLLARLRENYWILRMRKVAKSVISNCVVCKRHKIKPIEVPFAPLPKDRIGHTQVFEVSGVDYAGPLYLNSQEKAWVVLFTCAVYRAVHLEVVQSLSTSAFLQALRRFIARRGRISVIYSDNGTNFVGANNAFKSLDWKEILAFSTVKRITWKFNPPSAAWWGGWWERMVRMLKELLRRILGNASVDYEELSTILCDCESVINSRPLTYVTDDSNELIPLTPATFLRGLSNSEIPDLDSVDRSTLVRRYRYLQKLREDLRQRFRNEYLALLVHRGQRKDDSIRVGDIVLIGDDVTKRIKWPLGIVLQVYPGIDGVPRVARVKTSQSEKIRPFQRLFPLEIASKGEMNQITPNVALPRPITTITEESSNKVSKPVKRSAVTVSTRLGRKIKVPQRLDL